MSVNFFVGRRVAFAQFGQQIFQRRGFEFGAQFGIGGRRFAESFKKGFEVKSGAAAKNRHAPARLDFRHGAMREPGELRGVERFGQIADVNEVMRHAGAVGGRRFGRADVESAIDLHGIGGNDFAAELFREAQGDFRFADGGRAGDEDGARMEDGGLRMEIGCPFCHLQSSILYPRFSSRRESIAASARPAMKMGMLTNCPGVRP